MTIKFSPCTGLICCPEDCDPVPLPMCPCDPTLTIRYTLEVTVVQSSVASGDWTFDFLNGGPAGEWTNDLVLSDAGPTPQQWVVVPATHTDGLMRMRQYNSTTDATQEFPWEVSFDDFPLGADGSRILGRWVQSGPGVAPQVTDYLQDIILPCTDISLPLSGVGEIGVFRGSPTLTEVMANVTWSVEIV